MRADFSQGATDLKGGLPPPRFTLRAVFAGVALVALGLAVWIAVGPAWGLALGVFASIVVAHVAGNAIGSRLRDHGSQHARVTRPFSSSDAASPRATWSGGQLEAHHFAPVTRLSQRGSLGRLPLVATLLGALAGGFGGAAILQKVYPQQATLETLALGSAATAALGGLGAFWLICLAQALIGAWWQAHRHTRKS